MARIYFLVMYLNRTMRGCIVRGLAVYIILFIHTCFQSTERFCWRLFALYFSNVPIKTNVGSGVCVGSDNISDKYSKLLHFSHFCLLSQQSYQKLMNLTAIFGLLRLPCQKWKFRKLWQNKAKFLGQVLCQA